MEPEPGDSLVNLGQSRLNALEGCLVNALGARVGVSCNTRAVLYVQHAATRCNTLDHTAYETHTYLTDTLHHTATRCNTLQLAATPCITLHYTLLITRVLPPARRAIRVSFL